MMTARTSRTVRTALLASAGLCLSLAAGTAYAQNARPTEVFDSAHSSRPTDVVDTAQGATITSTSGSGYVSPGEAVDSPTVTINNNFTPTDARDPTNITGVGQFITDAGGGSVGLCTATLINPRTVLFAAHCVNTRAATAYGAGSGGVGTGIGFETNTRANAAGQTDELVTWLLAGPNQFRTNTAQAFYNISQVFYDPRSLAPASCTAPGSCFLEADIATAVLDTPTRNIPTWALLFSPLPTPGTIDAANGTGYHVVIDGYGRNGTGTNGATGNDFRRRVAENMLGGLTSLDDRNLFLFGSIGTVSRPQVLYWMDFDDPARGTIAANPRDFNGFRDNALPREGLTGPGDSGGPLILDRTFSKQVVIGTLSGGSTFFGGQTGGSYGTQSFYQPLFLYWDWIVANNPYHYVTATAGNKNWEDATAWVTELDPMYNILVGGQLVNGLPTNLGGGVANGPQFGEFCYQEGLNTPTPTVNECQNTNGTVRNNVPNNPGATVEGGVLTEQLGGNNDSAEIATIGSDGSTETAIAGRGDLTGPTESAQADPGFSNTVRPAATLTNGLPGATNFVPNNVDGVRTTGVIGKYFDVTLRNLGVVTLNSTVTVDRFSIAGAGAQLTVANGASLTSLIEINQMTGTVLNNGTITSGGDYILMTGLLSGSGRVNAPFVTSVLGSIAPGTINGGIGTLTIGGNLVLSSGNNFLVDLSTGGVSDRLVVTGAANIGGSVSLNYNSTIRAGETYTILTAAGGRTGTFATPSAISAILKPTLSYSANAVTLTVTAGLYGNIVPQSDTIAFAYALLLDKNRSQAGTRDALYGPLDFQNAATIRANLNGLRPASETTVQSLAFAGVSAQQGLVQERLGLLDPGSTGGTFARYGSPNQVAAIGLASRSVTGLSGMGFDMNATSGAGAPIIAENVLPEGTSGFVAGGYLNGDSASMNGVGGRDTYDGWYVAAGIETWDDNTGIGFSASYTRLDGTGAFVGNEARASLYQGSLYGKVETKGGINIDASITAGLLDGSTRRAVTFVGTPYVLTSQSGSLVVVSDLGLSGDVEMGSFKLTPRVGGRATHIGFSRSVEAGGPMALMIDRSPINSMQGRAGATLSGTGKVRPFITGTYVHEFNDRPGVIGANFAGGIGGNVLFDLNNIDKDWGEVSGGLAISTGNIELSVSAETTIDRVDVAGQAYRGSISFKF